jgi:hypothetical protein
MIARGRRLGPPTARSSVIAQCLQMIATLTDGVVKFDAHRLVVYINTAGEWSATR